jgi:hypothetical protein
VVAVSLVGGATGVLYTRRSVDGITAPESQRSQSPNYHFGCLQNH